jgi:hypothetical protein
MEVALAILAGVAAGGLGAAPPLVVVRGLRKMAAQSDVDGAGLIVRGMVAILLSFVILGVCIALCFFIASAYLLFFALTAILVFILCVIVYTAALSKHGTQRKGNDR